MFGISLATTTKIEVHQQLRSQPTKGLWEPQVTLLSCLPKLKVRRRKLKWSRCNNVRLVGLLEEAKKKELFKEEQVAPYGGQLFF